VPALFITGGGDLACFVMSVDWDGCGGAVDAVEVTGCLEQGGKGKAEDVASCGDQNASEIVSDVVTMELLLDATASERGIRLGRSS